MPRPSADIDQSTTRTIDLIAVSLASRTLMDDSHLDKSSTEKINADQPPNSKKIPPSKRKSDGQLTTSTEKTKRSLEMEIEDLETQYDELSELLEIAETNSSKSKDKDVALQGLTINADDKPREIFKVDKIQLFSINSEDNSVVGSKADSLRIVEVPGRLSSYTEGKTNLPPAFLQVGEYFVYPLIPGNSPIYRTEEGYYIFPDVKSDKAGACTGLVFPPTTPKNRIEEFERILKVFTAAEELSVAPPMMFGDSGKLISTAKENAASSTTTKEGKGKSVPTKKAKENSKGTAPLNKVIRTLEDASHCYEGEEDETDALALNHTASQISTRIADGILAGAEIITRGFAFGARTTADCVEYCGGYLKNNLEPAHHPKRIHGKLKHAVRLAKEYTGTAVDLSGYIVTELHNVTRGLASILSPYLHQATTTFMSKVTGGSEPESANLVNNVVVVTTGTFQGMHMIFTGLHAAGKLLAKSITNNTVEVITHCYGTPAGEIVDDAAETVGNIALTGSLAHSLCPKSLVKDTIKSAGVILLTHDMSSQ